MRTETWFAWKEYAPDESGELRFLTPWSDPETHEYPIDWLFKTPAEAEIAKNEVAPEECWILVEVSFKAVGAYGPVECPECGTEFDPYFQKGNTLVCVHCKNEIDIDPNGACKREEETG